MFLSSKGDTLDREHRNRNAVFKARQLKVRTYTHEHPDLHTCSHLHHASRQHTTLTSAEQAVVSLYDISNLVHKLRTHASELNLRGHAGRKHMPRLCTRAHTTHTLPRRQVR